MYYKFYGAGSLPLPVPVKKYEKITSQRMLYDMLSKIWCADTCAPRMRQDWTPANKTLGQCSITAFLAQDIFGGEVYGIPRDGGNFHCYNVIGECVFDLTSEQFGDEKLIYENNPLQLRETHFAKEEKRLRYEYIRKELDALYERIKVYKALGISEDDYGCEELSENAELMCRVLAEDERGEKSALRLPDGWLSENDIREGGAFALF